VARGVLPGSNDISVGADADSITDRTKQLIQILHEKSPKTLFYFASIQEPLEKRERWDVVEAVNRRMEHDSHQAVNVGYIDLSTVLFDNRDSARENLFPDRLHFRPDSTADAKYSKLVRPILTEAWESATSLPKSNY
jgi:hypothetical protein